VIQAEDELLKIEKALIKYINSKPNKTQLIEAKNNLIALRLEKSKLREIINNPNIIKTQLINRQGVPSKVTNKFQKQIRDVYHVTDTKFKEILKGDKFEVKPGELGAGRKQFKEDHFFTDVAASFGYAKGKPQIIRFKKVKIQKFSNKLQSIIKKAEKGLLTEKQIKKLRIDLNTEIKKNPGKFFSGPRTTALGRGESEVVIPVGSKFITKKNLRTKFNSLIGRKVGNKITYDNDTEQFIQVMDLVAKPKEKKFISSFKEDFINNIKQVKTNVKFGFTNSDMTKVRSFKRALTNAKGTISETKRKGILNKLKSIWENVLKNLNQKIKKKLIKVSDKKIKKDIKVKSKPKKKVVKKRPTKKVIKKKVSRTFKQRKSPVRVFKPRSPSKPEPRSPSKPKPRDPSKPEPRSPSKPKPRDPSKPKPRDPSKPKPRDPSKPKGDDPQTIIGRIITEEKPDGDRNFNFKKGNVINPIRSKLNNLKLSKTRKQTKIPKLNFNGRILDNKILTFEGIFRERKFSNKLASKLNPIVTKKIMIRDTKNRVLKKVAQRVDNTLTASLQLRVIGLGKSKKDISTPKILNKFKLKKSKLTPVLQLVEKNKNRFDTKGEVKETKKQKLIKKKIVKSKPKKKVVKKRPTKKVIKKKVNKKKR